MGRRGPPKKPTKLKLLQGVPGGEHKLNRHEPQVQPTVGAVAPDWLTEPGREVWTIVAPKLEKMQILSDVDINSLARYCDMLPRWIALRDFLDKHGTVYPVYYDMSEQALRDGVKPVLKNMRIFPQTKLYKEFSTELSRLEAQFGMTPASRAAISTLTSGAGAQREDFRSWLYQGVGN